MFESFGRALTRAICYPLRMGSTCGPRTTALLLLAWTFTTGCSVSAKATTGSNGGQCRIDAEVLCPGNFVGYSCQGESKPVAHVRRRNPRDRWRDGLLLRRSNPEYLRRRSCRGLHGRVNRLFLHRRRPAKLRRSLALLRHGRHGLERRETLLLHRRYVGQLRRGCERQRLYRRLRWFLLHRSGRPRSNATFARLQRRDAWPQ